VTSRRNEQEGRSSGPLRLSLLVLLVALLFFAGWLLQQQDEPVIHAFDGLTMGSGWSVRVVASPDLDTALLRARIEQRLSELDQQLSGYRPGTGVSVVNAASLGTWVPLPPDLAAVLRKGFDLHRQTGGAFDMTVRPLVLLWGFGAAEPRDAPPSEQEIREARSHLASDQFEISASGDRIRRHADATLDVDAIAPGHVADEISRLLSEAALPDHLVEIGGELRARGRRPGGSGWRIGIERPVLQRADIAEVIEVSDAGVATSGDYRDYFEVGGVRYSHTLDPRTGRPVSHELASVTVIAPTTLAADGYATALTVMGPEAGMRFAEDHGLAVFMILRDASGKLSERYNPRFAPYLGTKP
jgi:thiamine biosynthesis lipoprotein